jgi:hypothetical protein
MESSGIVVLSRGERVTEMLRRLSKTAPFSDGADARAALERIVREVEDEHSGVPEDPNAHLAKTSDGRMYPPHDRFAFPSGSPHISAFGQTGHRTFFGDNGAVRIERRSDGMAEIDIPGADGKTITDLRTETKREAN